MLVLLLASEVNIFWTEERVETLKRVAKDGGSFADAARQIGHGANRNMVAGKAYRLKIEFSCSYERHRVRCSRGMKKYWDKKSSQEKGAVGVRLRLARIQNETSEP